ncbi:hypothetical protein Tco_1491129 [Tanacetum coccineum]
MATPIISIFSDSSEESVGSSNSWVVMFGTIPTVIHADVSTIIPVVPEVAVAIVASPTEVLELDVHSTLETDPFEDLSSLVHAPTAPIVSLFLHSSDSSEASDDSSGSDSFESLSSLDSHVIVPTPPGVPRQPAILVLHGQEIPFGRPYRTYPNGVLRMLTAMKRVHPFLARIPVNRRRFYSSSSSPPCKRHKASSYSSSSYSPDSIADDSPTPHRFVDPHPIRTPRDSEAYCRWKAAPLSTVYPPTTFESSSGDFSSDLSTSSSERPPHSFDTHSPTPSPSAGPSGKRCRSPATSIPLTTPTLRSLSPTRADLLTPRKRIRGFSAASYPEDSSKGSMEVGSEDDIDSDVMAYIEADITAEAATAEEIRAETKVGLERDDKVEDEADSSARGTIEIGVDRVVEPEMPADNLVPINDGGFRENFKIGLDVVIQELYDHMMETHIQRFPWTMRERTRLRERVSKLKGSNMRLMRALAEERERADSVWHRMRYIQEELRQIRSSCYHDRMGVRRLETFAMRGLGYRP